MGALEEWKGKKPGEPRGSNMFGDDSDNEDQIGKPANTKRAAKHVGVVARTLGVYHRKGKQVKSKAAMLLSKHDVPQSKEEEVIKAEPCPKPEVKAEPCPKPPKQDPPIKVEPESPPKMDNRQPGTYTSSDDDLLSSHSCDSLNTSIVSSSVDDANEYEEFPPTQLFEKGDVFSSLVEGQDAYREAAFAAPPRRVQQTIKCLKICLTPSQVQRSLRRPHVDLRRNQVYATCVMRRSPENATPLLFSRCHVMHALPKILLGQEMLSCHVSCIVLCYVVFFSCCVVLCCFVLLCFVVLCYSLFCFLGVLCCLCCDMLFRVVLCCAGFWLVCFNPSRIMVCRDVVTRMCCTMHTAPSLRYAAGFMPPL